MRLHYVTRKHVSHVQLTKEGKSSLGIIPKGSSKSGKPTVKSIQLKSVAHRSHCVAVGDVIVAVCGLDSSGMGKRDVRRLLHHAADTAELQLEYEIREPRLSTSGIYQYERMSVKIKRSLDSFGFVLRNQAQKNPVCSEYPIISNITQNGKVDKEMFLRAGDRLIQIDDEDLSWLTLTEISNILDEKEEATFLVEYNIGIVDLRPGERIELELELLDADLGVSLASSSTDMSSTVIEKIQKGSLAERCGVFHVGDVVLSINDISTAHLSSTDANNLIRSFKKRPGKLIFVPYTTGFEPEKEIILETRWSRDSNENGPKELHPMHHTLLNERNHLIPPHNSPASLYNWHFKRTHSTLAKTDRKSFDFQSKTISLLRHVILNLSTMQQLVPYLDCHPRRNCKVPHHHTCHSEDGSFVKVDINGLSQLEAMCTETKDSARSIAMHFVKNSINVSLLNDSSDLTLDGTCGNSGDNSYFTRSKMIQELTENLTEIYTKKFISKHALDRFLGNVSAVDFDCYECYQLCLSAALTVQKVMLLLALNDPDLDAMFVINTLIMSVVKVDVPCEDCRTPWCSVSEVGKPSSCFKEDYDNPCGRLCHSENYQTPTADPFYLSLMHHTGFSNSRNSLNGSKDNIARTFNRAYSKRSGVNLNMAEKSAYYTLAQIQSTLSSAGSEKGSMCGLLPEKVIISSKKMHSGKNSRTSQRSYSFTEQPKVPNNTPSDSKVAERGQKSERTENYTQNCKEKIHVDKNMLSTPRQEWKSEEAISRSKNKHTLSAKLKSVITKHASDPSGFVKNLQTPMDIFKSCSSSRPESPETYTADCVRSRSTSSNNGESRLSSGSLGSIRTHSSTMEVNLKNEGKGFGLEIELVSFPKDSSTMPIIVEVEPDTAAAKSGILLKGDRIASINGQGTVGLTVNEFAELTKDAFAQEEVSLTVEFDVALPEVRFGTFDIYFDKALKTGLEFKDFSQGSPLVVRGVAKGSAAHRSGQLFAGDEILFTNCIRQEAFDSRNCSYHRTDMVLMTVRREDTEHNPNPDPESSLPPQHPPSSASDACAVHRTSLHTVSGSGALILEQQLILRRDPRLRDFGFLVGQNQGTGGVFVTGVRPGGPAERSRAIKKNDRIVEIDGIPVGNKESSSLSLLLQAGDHLELVTRRMLSCKE